MLPKYGCFISYRHSITDMSQIFVQEFKQSFERARFKLEAAKLERYVLVDREFIPPDLGGPALDTILEEAIYHSACMVMLFTPTYFHEQATYCAREYLAMKHLQEKRHEQLGGTAQQLIIPILFRGTHLDLVPTEIRNNYQWFDFSSFPAWRLRPLFPESAPNALYDQIVQAIYDRVLTLQQLAAPPIARGEFKLPTNEDAIAWLENNGPSKPGTSFF
jgi:hypothetical protein